MTDIEKLTAWMLAQVGTRENGENNVIYNTDYYGREVQGPQYPWCMAFIWDGFQQTGLGRLFLGGGKSAYCPYVVNWARMHGAWVTEGYRAGDILLFDFNGDGLPDHTGFCTGMSNGRLDGVEGNVSDAVCVTHRTPASVMGAYRPAYTGAETQPGEAPQAPAAILPTVRRGDKNGAVLSVQNLLIHKWAVSCGIDGADGDFGPNTESAVKAFQTHKGLDPDGVVGPMTWAAIIN